MAAEQDIYIDIDRRDIDRRDIDRRPERERARPAGVGGAALGGTSPLWPALAGTPGSRDPHDVGVAPLGAVPVEAQHGPAPADWANVPAARPARLPDAELADSLATLAPKPSLTRPISLADALAAMPAHAPCAASAPAASDSPGELVVIEQSLAEAPTLPSLASQSLAAEGLPCAAEEPDGWRTPDGIVHIRVSAAESLPVSLLPPAEVLANDEYLARSYDFTRPEVAELYDRAVVPMWSAPFGRMLLSAFQGCPRQPGWQVVDVACGTGYPTLELAHLLGPSGDVAGVDVWGAGIARARAKAGDLRLKNVAFLVADVADCDLPERAFDAAICNLGLTNFARPEAALKGIARLLQPNGTLILTTNLYGTMQEFFETYRSVLNDLGLLDLSWDVERLMHMQPTVERVEGLLDMAGFTVDQTLSDHFALEFPDGSTFLRSPLVGLSFLHSWRTLVSDGSLRRVVFNEIERRLNARADAWGRLDLIVPMLCVTARKRAEE